MTAYSADEAPEVRIRALEGTEVVGEVLVRVMVRSSSQLVLDVTMAAGARSSPHTHACDSAGVILSGQVIAEVDGRTVTLRAGDGFHHPEGVEHHVEALEDSRWIEIKSQPVEPWIC